MEPISGDSLRGHLETMALAALERGEAHGFEILRRLEEAGCGALRLTCLLHFDLTVPGTINGGYRLAPPPANVRFLRVSGPSTSHSVAGRYILQQPGQLFLPICSRTTLASQPPLP